MKPMYSDFYSFGKALVMTTCRADTEQELQWIINKEFDKCNELERCLSFGEYGDISFPVIFRQDREYGNKWRDLLPCGISFYLISERFRALLEEYKITGWRCYPIELFDKKGLKVEGYHGFSVIGRAGNIMEFETPPEELGYSPKSFGWHFNMDLWDGSDIFQLSPRGIAITTKLAEVLIKHKVSGIEMARLTDYGDWKKHKRIL